MTCFVFFKRYKFWCVTGNNKCLNWEKVSTDTLISYSCCLALAMKIKLNSVSGLWKNYDKNNTILNMQHIKTIIIIFLLKKIFFYILVDEGCMYWYAIHNNIKLSHTTFKFLETDANNNIHDDKHLSWNLFKMHNWCQTYSMSKYTKGFFKVLNGNNNATWEQPTMMGMSTTTM